MIDCARRKNRPLTQKQSSGDQGFAAVLEPRNNDVLGDAKASRYNAALGACLADGNVDGVLVIFTQQIISQPFEIAQSIVELVKHPESKPVFVSFMGDRMLQDAKTLLNANGIPAYPTPENAVKTYMKPVPLPTQHQPSRRENPKPTCSLNKPKNSLTAFSPRLPARTGKF
jgi:acyl-CoA synthetase (NDP forming)